MMKRAFTNILCPDVERTARFYEELLGMTRRGDFGWFVLLGHDDMPELELGLLDVSHETVPPELAGNPCGHILTFVVDDVDGSHQRAIDMGAEVLQEPTDLFYGQRRLLLRDPAGATVDISAPVAGT